MLQPRFTIGTTLHDHRPAGAAPRRFRAVPFARGRRGGGFSLVELLIVLAIVAVLSAIAAPRWGNAVSRYRADAAARRIASDLAGARATARAMSASRTVVFDVAANTCSIAGLTSLDRASGASVLRLGSEPYLATLVSADFKGAATVTFTGFGAAPAGNVLLRSGREFRRVTLAEASGDTAITTVPRTDPAAAAALAAAGL